MSYGSTVVKKNKLTVSTNTAVSFESIQYEVPHKKNSLPTYLSSLPQKKLSNNLEKKQNKETISDPLFKFSSSVGTQRWKVVKVLIV